MLETMESPYKRALDGPSRQLLWELGRLHINDRQNFNARLDKDAQERELTHKTALAAAALEHDRIRKEAEAVREKIELQVQRERAEIERRNLEKRKELERQRQMVIEKELADKKREADRKLAIEAERERVEQLRRDEFAAAQQAKAEQERRKTEEARRLAEQKNAEANRKAAQHEQAHRLAAEAERKAKEADTMALNARSNSRPPAVQSQSIRPASHISQINPHLEAEHQRYLVIHDRLKELRRFLVEESTRNPALKEKMGDARRTIRKCVGQLTEGKSVNRLPMNQVNVTLKSALAFTVPKVDVTMFLASPPAGIADTQGPALLVYLLNIFAKALVSQFINESGVSPRSADPVGVIGSSIFAQSDFRWNGISLIDILIAKFHIVCPVLFGIYGDEDSNEGKRALAWERDHKTGPWVSEQRHLERMTGLGAGYAAVSLRNYGKSKLTNPYPPINFWKAVMNITSVPAQDVTSTHFTVLKSMLANNETRIIELFGDCGLNMIRRASIGFPQQVGTSSVAAKGVTILTDVMRKDKKIFL